MTLAAVAGLLVASIAPTPASAAPAGGDRAAGGFVSFRTFLSNVGNAEFSGLAARGQAGIVRGRASFDQMRAYVLDTYRGVSVTHSYVDNGNVFDCVVTATQPSLRELGTTLVATPPAVVRGRKPARSTPVPLLARGLMDPYGNRIFCADGTVPMQRITLDRLTQFSSLDDFLSKPRADADPSHRYAVGVQALANQGANASLNLWKPVVSGPQNFSDSHVRLTAGSGTGVQTVEGGWVKSPARFGADPVLYVAFLPAAAGTGCWNLDCPGFVQLDSQIAPGGSFANYSTEGGDQWILPIQWQYDSGAWWLYVGDTVVGYYPNSVYGTGPLASGTATGLDFGGETLAYEGTRWPQMGSGRFASAGWAHAAIQGDLFAIASGRATDVSLTTVQENPACYTVAKEGTDGLYFGGPGGIC